MNREEKLDDTLSAFFEVVYRRHRLGGKTPTSAHNFRTQIRHLSKFLGRPALLSDLSDETILDCMQWQMDRGRTAATCNKVYIHLVAIWNFAARKNLTGGIWPTLQKYPEPERTPRAWTETQLRILFLALSHATGRIGGLPADEFHVCHNSVIWFSAERKRASLLIRVEDFDLDTGWFKIRGETRKGKTRDLMRRIPEILLPRFRRFVEYDPDRELLFPLDCTLQTLANRYRAILKSAGLPCGRDSLYQRMRRSAISHFKRLGGNGTELADHSSPQITRESYEDPTICGQQQGADLLFLPFPPESEDPPRAA